MREICIRRRDNALDAAVLEDGRLVEYMPLSTEGAAENVLLGRVERVVPGMKAAFVRIGQEKNGFLPLEEKNVGELPRLQAGQPVIVQIRKEAQGVKGAYLSREISLCGEYVLVNPLGRRIAVSSRITQEGARKHLRALGTAIAEERCGMVMRASCLDADEDAVREEAERLISQWQGIVKAAATAHVPSVLYSQRTALDALIEDYAPRGIDRICTNDPQLAERMQAIASVQLLSDGMFDVMRVSNQVERALERRVWLDNGGNLVIDPCEALTVVDVNTAKFTGDHDHQETVLRMNLDACAEIARQVRLRNISGIIIIDMIDMTGRERQQAVLEELRKHFAADRVKTVIHGFTSLGLVEMTRRRSRPPLREVLRTETHQEE